MRTRSECREGPVAFQQGFHRLVSCKVERNEAECILDVDIRAVLDEVFDEFQLSPPCGDM